MFHNGAVLIELEIEHKLLGGGGVDCITIHIYQQGDYKISNSGKTIFSGNIENPPCVKVYDRYTSRFNWKVVKDGISEKKHIR